MALAVRILFLANSYPSAAAPSSATYLSARLRCLAADPAVSVRAMALVPGYTRPAEVIRRAGGGASGRGLALAPGAGQSLGWEAVPVRWGLPDVLAGRRGRRPGAALARAVTGVLAVLERPAGPGAGCGRERFDVVHAHGMYALPAGEVARQVAARLGIPFVVSMHGSDVTVAMAAGPADAAATLAGASATIYVSGALRERALALGAPRERSHVIPNGADLGLFTPAARPARGPGAGPRLLFAGNLLPAKGADRLAGIVEQVAARRPGTRLVVAGDGPEAPRLRSRLGDRVSLLGRVPQARVAELMAAADVLLVPSRSEGWGCVVTEAYAAGTPVVAAAVGGLPEAVLDERALVATAGERDERRIAAAFAGRVLDVLDDPPAPGEMAAHVAGSSWEAVVAAELAVLSGAVAGRMRR